MSDNIEYGNLPDSMGDDPNIPFQGSKVMATAMQIAQKEQEHLQKCESLVRRLATFAKEYDHSYGNALPPELVAIEEEAKALFP